VRADPDHSSVRLSVPFPNPSHGATRFSLELPVSGTVRVVVRDLAGRDVHVLLQSWLPAGRHDVSWDGLSEGGGIAAAGIYFADVEVRSPEGVERVSRRFVALR